MSDQLSKAESRLWQAKPIMAGYFISGYLIARGDEEPIARTICRDEADDEEASELIVSALNHIESAAPVEVGEVENDTPEMFPGTLAGLETLGVKRFYCDATVFGTPTMIEDPGAGYVRHDDYATLARQISESEALIAEADTLLVKTITELEHERFLREQAEAFCLQVQTQRDKAIELLEEALYKMKSYEMSLDWEFGSCSLSSESPLEDWSPTIQQIVKYLQENKNE